ncbi:MAG TPA: DoxX family protein [Longimicrobiaceae bacterium]
MSATQTQTISRKRNVALWTVQVLLAALFLFAGVTKLVMPAAALTAQGPFSAEFLRFIGVCETLGALGLILPGIFRIRQELTPLAAAGLVTIMFGATVSTAVTMAVAPAIIPAIVGVLAATVAWNRRHVVPSRRAAGRAVLQPAS